MYLGDFIPGQPVKFTWSTNAKTGGSITRFGNGSLVVYRDTDLNESVSGITDIEDFDSRVGIHKGIIDTASNAAFYVPHEDYQVVLVGSNIDGETVNATIASFSILNRAASMLMEAGTISAAFSPTVNRIQCADITMPTGFFNRRTVWGGFGSGWFRQHGVIQTYTLTSGRGDFVFVSPLSVLPVAGERILVI